MTRTRRSLSFATSSDDPSFLVVFAIVALGVFLTGCSHLTERRTGG